ncbi:hypothetical protein ACFCV3_41950 [Kribbella sp. NPDC056345]|uniref:DUF7574 domain-containing protein n=1 Tax=Kribbella sp. NPDC056345 TaxID=3345789 RepID=UPI0035DB1C19
MSLLYSPEDHGLTLVGELDFSSGSYEFDYTAVWIDAEGNLKWADDSGCSCPSPFEDHTPESLEHGPVDRLRDHLESRYRDQYGGYVTREALERFMTTVTEALRD